MGKCYSPLKAWRAKTVNANGKRPVVFNRDAGHTDMPIDLPCGQCIGCRLEKSRQWALRCVHESKLYQDNCFITLTYDDDNLPENANLNLRHFQLFLKTFRKAIAPHKIRYFHCGEYGDNDVTNNKHISQYGISKLGRPHYHAIIFGYDFYDKQLLRERDGIKLYHSAELSKYWPHGFNTIGAVTFESAAYVARYICKKRTGDKADGHYTRIYPDTGLSVSIEPEYVTMSRRPGIATGWFQKFQGDVYPKDFTTIRGKKIKPPKFYDSLLEQQDQELYQEIKTNRIIQAKDPKQKEDNTGQRLLDKEQVKKVQFKMLKRNLDESEEL